MPDDLFCCVCLAPLGQSILPVVRFQQRVWSTAMPILRQFHSGDTRLVYAGTHAFRRIASITTVSPNVFAQNWLREVLSLAVLFEKICVPCRSVYSGRIAVSPDRPTDPLRGPIRAGNLEIEVLCPRGSRRCPPRSVLCPTVWERNTYSQNCPSISPLTPAVALQSAGMPFMR